MKIKREFSARNFGYSQASKASAFDLTTLPVEEIFTDENINLTDGIRLTEITSPSDSYKASNWQLAGYLSAKIPFTSKISLYTGLRIEKTNRH